MISDERIARWIANAEAWRQGKRPANLEALQASLDQSLEIRRQLDWRRDARWQRIRYLERCIERVLYPKADLR